MKQLLTVLGAAGLLVLAWVLTSGSNENPGRAGFGDLGNRDGGGPGLGGGNLSQPMGPLTPEAAEALEMRTAGGGIRIPNRDLMSRAQERGVVGAATMDIVSKMRGSRIPPVDRSFALEDISRIVNAWTKDPGREHEDMTFILDVWNEIDDPAVRYALSWLFERSYDPRCLDALTALINVDPGRMIDAMAKVKAPQAVERIADLYRDGDLPRDNPAVRQRALALLAGHDWEGGVDLFERTWTDPTLSPIERIVAVEGLGQLEHDPEAGHRALEVALGGAQPIAIPPGREADHPEGDLRSPAVMSLMVLGNLDSARKLLTEAESSDDPTLQSIVERHIGVFQGPDISNYLVTRCRRTQRVSYGIAMYLNRAARADLVPEIRSLRQMAQDKATRDLLDAAILNARGR